MARKILIFICSTTTLSAEDRTRTTSVRAKQFTNLATNEKNATKPEGVSATLHGVLAALGVFSVTWPRRQLGGIAFHGHEEAHVVFIST